MLVSQFYSMKRACVLRQNQPKCHPIQRRGWSVYYSGSANREQELPYEVGCPSMAEGAAKKAPKKAKKAPKKATQYLHRDHHQMQTDKWERDQGYLLPL